MPVFFKGENQPYGYKCKRQWTISSWWIMPAGRDVTLWLQENC